MKKAQILLGFLGMILIFFGFLVIILLNLVNLNTNFGYIFRRFINLSSLEISGFRYALYQINTIPNFTTNSARVNLPQGYFFYSVNTTTNPNLRLITIESYLTTTPMRKIFRATATIDSNNLRIIDLNISD